MSDPVVHTTYGLRYARLYWAGRGAGIDAAVTLDRPGTSATVAVTADATSLVASEQPQWAQATADVTAFVSAQGAGLFRFSNFDFEDVRNKNEQTAFAGWSLMVVYEDDAAPNRNIALFDGLDLVATRSEPHRGGARTLLRLTPRGRALCAEAGAHATTAPGGAA